MKRVLAAVSAGALLLSLDSSAQPIGARSEIMPAEAASAIEQTPCPEAAKVSVEACLLWLFRPQDSADRAGADVIAGSKGDDPAAAAAAFATGLYGAPEPEVEPAAPAPPPDPLPIGE